MQSNIPIAIWFPTKALTTHALINLIESIRPSLDEGRFGRGIFVDLQKDLILLIIKSCSTN